MGVAVLPARLKDEMAHVKENLLKGTKDISGIEDIAKHADWYKKLRENYNNINESNIDEIIRKEIGQVFSVVLSHAGVFKRDEKGQVAFDKFVETVSA